METALDDIIARIEATKAKAEELAHKNSRLVRELDRALVQLGKARIEAAGVDGPPKPKARRKKPG